MAVDGRRILNLTCAYCCEEVDGIWYGGPNSDLNILTCRCGRVSYITSELQVLGIESVTLKMIREDIKSCSPSCKGNELERECNRQLERLHTLIAQ